MKVFVDKAMFGSEKNLILEEGSFYWSSSNCDDCDLKLDHDKNNNLNSFLKLYGIEPIELIEENYLKIIDTLKINSPKWKFILPAEDFSRKTRVFQEELQKAKDFLFENKYSSSFSDGNFVLKKIEKIKPNVEVINSFLQKEKNPTLRNIISSFRPNKSGYCDKIIYDRLKTVTGRLIVKSGPQVLLLPREAKNIFASEYGEDGRIFWVDFVSLEPRFTKLLFCNKTEVDIYSDLIKKAGLECSRDQVKLAVLASLYGAGISKLTEIVGENAFLVKKAIKDYFEFDRILKTVGNYKSGKISNYFGRPISLKKLSSNVALNNYIQSSSVDVSLMGFSKFIKSGLPESARPLCVVHDALVLDVRNDDIDELVRIVNKGVQIDGVGNFYLGLETYESNS